MKYLPLSFTFLFPFQNFVNDPPSDNFFLFFLSMLSVALPLLSGGGDPGSCDEDDDIVKPLCSAGLWSDCVLTEGAALSAFDNVLLGTKKKNTCITAYGKFLEGSNIGKWANRNQLKGKIL